MKSIKHGMSCTAGIYPHGDRSDVRVSELIFGLKAMTEAEASETRTSWIDVFRNEEDGSKVAFMPLCCTTSDE
jgi:hypothetical protein